MSRQNFDELMVISVFNLQVDEFMEVATEKIDILLLTQLMKDIINLQLQD